MKLFNTLGQALKNSKVRLIVILVAVVLIIAIGIIIYRLSGGGIAGGKARVAKIPESIQSVPGSTTENQRYLQALLKSNQQAADKALKEGKSEVSTLIASPSQSQSVNFQASKTTAITPAACPPCAAVAGKANPADAFVDQLQANNVISAAVASELKALDADGLTPSAYQARLAALEASGKISPQAAKQLLAVYKAQRSAGQLSSADDNPDAIVNQLLANGKISKAVAAELKALNAEGLTPAQYAKKLNALITKGDLSAAAAQRLLAAYKQEKLTPDALINRLLAAKKITPQTAADLKALDAKGLSAAAYAKRLSDLVASKALTPQEAQQLLAAYKEERDHLNSPDQAATKLGQAGLLGQESVSRLNTLSAQNVPVSQYAAEINRLVRAGKLSPEQAKQLLEAYQAKKALAAEQGASGQGGQQLTAQQKLAQLTAEQQQQDQAQQGDAEVQALSKAEQAQQQAMQGSIANQVKQLLKAWGPTKQKRFGELVDEKAKAKKDEKHHSAGSSDSSEKDKTKQVGPSMIKAGAILFGVLDTAVNSDQPGPIMATVVAGKYKGARLLGTLQVASDYEGVMLKFNTMVMNSWPQAIQINAVAIDPDTARTALASDVDHHYLLRYGALFASSFMEGIGNAVMKSGSSSVNSSGTVTQTVNTLNTGEKALVGLGQVGKSFGQAAKKLYDTKPTVTVNSGTGVGILFTKGTAWPDFLKSNNVSDSE